jgi:hypothetical protein
MRASGYRAHLAFVSLPSPEMAELRVAERVRRGGHAIPGEVIRRRYAAGLRNFFGLYRDVVDSWQMLIIPLQGLLACWPPATWASLPRFSTRPPGRTS